MNMTCRKGTLSRKGLAIVYRAALNAGRVYEEVASWWQDDSDSDSGS